MLNQSVPAYQEIKTSLVRKLQAHKVKRSIRFLKVFRVKVNYSVSPAFIFFPENVDVVRDLIMKMESWSFKHQQKEKLQPNWGTKTYRP